MSAAVPVITEEKVRWHKRISYLKSAIRIVAFLELAKGAWAFAAFLLIVAEVFGFAEEIFGA